MNIIAARSRETYGGFLAEYRLAHWGDYRPVRTEDGAPEIFNSDKDAEVAAHRALTAALVPEIRAERGEPAKGGARSKAESLFGAIFRRGRRIEVARK